MMFFIFVFCATINHYGLSRFISLWFITRKFVAGRPWVFTFTFLASMFILGGLTSASPAAIIGWSILCTLTLGLGNLALRPYEMAAIAAFYREISGGVAPKPELGSAF